MGGVYMAVWICERCGNKYSLKLEADFAVDPTRCGKCRLTIELHTFPLSFSLKEDLVAWGDDYGKWIDFKCDSLIENGIELEDEFNKKGIQLTERVKNELGEQFTVTFSPSLSAQSYKYKKGLFD